MELGGWEHSNIVNWNLFPIQYCASSVNTQRNYSTSEELAFQWERQDEYTRNHNEFIDSLRTPICYKSLNYMLWHFYPNIEEQKIIFPTSHLGSWAAVL